MNLGSAAVAALCALGVISTLGGGPGWLALPAAVYLLGHGLAAPWIRRATPGSPDRGKLALFALALSPITALVISLAVRFCVPGVESNAALGQAAWMALGGAFAFLAPGRAVHAQRASRGRLAIRAIALVAAGVVAWLTLRGSAVRVSHHGLLHAGLALATDRSIPPGNPWMAGEPLGYYWIWHALVALVARALTLPVTFAAAALSIWSMGLTVLATGLCAATCLRSGAREVAAVVFGLVGLGAVGGIGWLIAGARFQTPSNALELLAVLRESLVPKMDGPGGAGTQPLFDPRLAFGPSKFFNVSSYPASFALAACGLAAAAHALRSGARPWPLLTGLTLGASFALNPLIGAPALAAVGLSAVLFPGAPRVRLDLPLALGVAALPGVWSVLEARASFEGEAVSFGFSMGETIGAVAPLVPLGLAALLGLWPGASPQERERSRELRPARAMLWLAVWIALGLGALAQLPYANEYKFVRFAALPLAILAAAGLGHAFGRSVLGKLAAVSAGAVLLVGGAAGATLSVWAYGELAQVDLPLIERAGRLTPIPAAETEWQSESTQRAALFDFLSTDPRVREANPVLWMSTLDHEKLITRPRYGAKRRSGEPFGPLHSFSGELNLQAHEGPAFAQLDLYLDRPSQVLAGEGAAFLHRVERLEAIFFGKADWGSPERAAFEELDRPVLVFAGELERSVRLDLTSHLELFGFREIYRSGGARLYAWPQAFAERFGSSGSGPPSAPSHSTGAGNND